MKLVLVVDDEAALLDVFASVIADLGHRVLTAHDGVEALALARTHLPDLVVSDHMMPHLSGLDLLRLIRGEAALAQTPFILVSAATPKGAEAATAMLTKPVPLEQFERAVEAALKNHPSPRERQDEVPVTMTSPRASGRIGGEMLAWVAHEIKTPLSAARINLQLLQRELTEQPKPRRRAEVVLTQLDRMTALVNSVLDATQLSEGRVQLHLAEVQLNRFLDGVVSFWRESQPEQHFELTLPGQEVTLSMDQDRVRTILDNLLSNAVKYGDASPISVSLDLSPGRVSIKVSDRGHGIDAAELPHLFDRFHRADGSSGEGHGLGLYIAAASARLHGGSLTAKSEHGDGATFTLTLPVMQRM